MIANQPDWSVAGGAYDALASRYDRIPEDNRVNRVLRARSLQRLGELFHPGQYVLEIGCGTGDEALALAARGVRVFAVDPSEAMIRVANSKARDRGLDDRAIFVRARAREVDGLRIKPASFDGAYASFSLAYEPDLRPVAAILHGLLRQDTVMVASVPSRLCLLEWIAALAVMRPSVAGRRLRPWHGHAVGGQRVPIRTYTPRGLAESLAPEFALSRWEALGALVPPPWMNPWYARLDGLSDAIERADERWRRGLLRSAGDHFLAEFRHVAVH